MEQCNTEAFLSLAQSEEGRKSICVMAEEFNHFHPILTHSLLGSQRTIWTLNCYPTWMEVAA